MKKTILATSLALALSTSAFAGDLISNDTLQSAVADVQLNLIAELNAVSVGNTVFSQANVINSADVTLDTGATGDAWFNDVNQLSLGNVQGNAVATLTGINVGNTKIDQVNAINVASVDIDVWDDAIGNDVRQLSVGSIQANVVAMGEFASVGKTAISQANVANSAQLDIDVDSNIGNSIEVVSGNDVLQRADYAFQGNLALVADVLSAGTLTVDQVNAINVASTNFTDGEFVSFNDVRQVTTNAVQGNGLYVAQGVNVGRLDVSQANVANSADVAYTIEIDGNGTSVALDNDITQRVKNVDQDNIVNAVQGLGIGKTDISQVNAMNVAAMDMAGQGIGVTDFVGNDIRQYAFQGGLDQDNMITLGSVVNLGNVKIDQANVINSADMKLTGANFALGNDITQLAAGITQTNVTAMASLASVGNVNVAQVNAINVASMVIQP